MLICITPLRQERYMSLLRANKNNVYKGLTPVVAEYPFFGVPINSPASTEKYNLSVRTEACAHRCQLDALVNNSLIFSMIWGFPPISALIRDPAATAR